MKKTEKEILFSGTLQGNPEPKIVTFFTITAYVLMFCFFVLCLISGSWPAILISSICLLAFLMVFYLGSWTRVKYEVTAQCISLIPGNWITRAWERRYSWDEITEVYVQEMEFTRKPGRKRTFPDKKYIIIKKNRLTIPPEKRRYILFWKMEKNAICIPWNEDLQNYINGKTR